MTETLSQRILRHEGMVLHPYEDSFGNLSVGVGHLIQPGEHFTVLTQQEAMNLLDQDISKARKALLLNLPWVNGLPDIVQQVLTEMVFQMGIYKVLKFDATLKCAYRRDFSGMSSAMLQSLWARETPERAQELSQLVASAEPNPNVLSLQPIQTETV